MNMVPATPNYKRGHGTNPSDTMRDGDVKLPRAARDLSDIINVMDKSHYRANGDREQRKVFDDQWGIVPNYDEPELNASLELEEVPAKYGRGQSEG